MLSVQCGKGCGSIIHSRGHFWGNLLIEFNSTLFFKIQSSKRGVFSSQRGGPGQAGDCGRQVLASSKVGCGGREGWRAEPRSVLELVFIFIVEECMRVDDCSSGVEDKGD